MKLHNKLFTIAATVVLASCATQLEEPISLGGEEILITAKLADTHETKTILQNDGSVFWKPSDRISVFYGSGTKGGSCFTSQNTEDASLATFSGSINVVAGGNESAPAGNWFWGVYPYSPETSCDGNSMTTTLPSVQTAVKGTFADDLFLTIGKSRDLSIAFFNVCGGVKFSVSEEGIRSVTLRGNDDEALAGTANISFDKNGRPVVNEISDPATEITLTAPMYSYFEPGEWYYFVAYPTALSNGYTMTFKKDREMGSKSSSNSVTIKRSTFGQITNADNGVSFSSEGFVPDSDIIAFADPIAKYACVEKFDTDNDGEISYAEAAAVTSLDGLFTEWNTVKSFDEIQYFTNVTKINGLFLGCAQLESITLPEWITDIGGNSFGWCSSLASVVLPSTLATIGYQSFAYCRSLSSIEIPNTVTRLNNHVFINCTSLEEILLPNSITTMGEGVLKGCSSLKKANIPSGMNYIPRDTFNGCTNLYDVTIPDTIESINIYAFTGCEFVNPDKNNISTLVLPPSITTISGTNTFNRLHNIVIPSTTFVTFDQYVFDNAIDIYVPDNMVELYKLRSNWSDHADHIKPISTYSEEALVLPQYVDLGLSVKWATCNLGATSPEQAGDLFAWGEITPKEEYTWETYKWCEGTSSSRTKYNKIDNKVLLDLEDDAAYMIKGQGWHTPTENEYRELLQNCTVSFNEMFGTNVVIIESKVDGYKGNKIIFPRSNGWTSSLSSIGSVYARSFSPGSSAGIYSTFGVVEGLSIRPVHE